MKNKTKFVLVKLKIQNGEYEYSSKTVHELSTRKNPEKFAKDFAKGFYGNFSHSDGNLHFFNGGEVSVVSQGVTEITKEEYEILSKYH